jgi:hypothetical protein
MGLILATLIILFIIYGVIKDKTLFILVVFLAFSDYLFINLKYLADAPSFIGIYKDILLMLVALYYISKCSKNYFIYFIVIYLCLFFISLYDPSFRVLVNIFSLFMIGYFLKNDIRINKIHLTILSLILLLVCVYQYLTVTKFEDFWFYAYLSEKEGDAFLASIYAYARGDAIRTPGIQGSVGIMALLFLAMSILYDNIKYKNFLSEIIVKINCLIGIYLTQTRGVLIIFFFYEVFRFILKIKVIAPMIFVVYVSFLIGTFFIITLSGDESALVRVMLFLNYFDRVLNLTAFIPFTNEISLFKPLDSQVISFLNLGGFFSIVLLVYFIFIIFKFSLSSQYDNRYISLIGFVILFVCTFQWNGDSAGILILFFILANLLYKRGKYVK